MGRSLLDWKEIIDKAKLNPVIIKSELKETASLKRAKDNLQVEVDGTQNKLDVLNR